MSVVNSPVVRNVYYFTMYREGREPWFVFACGFKLVAQAVELRQLLSPHWKTRVNINEFWDNRIISVRCGIFRRECLRIYNLNIYVKFAATILPYEVSALNRDRTNSFVEKGKKKKDHVVPAYLQAKHFLSRLASSTSRLSAFRNTRPFLSARSRFSWHCLPLPVCFFALSIKKQKKKDYGLLLPCASPANSRDPLQVS